MYKYKSERAVTRIFFLAVSGSCTLASIERVGSIIYYATICFLIIEGRFDLFIDEIGLVSFDFVSRYFYGHRLSAPVPPLLLLPLLIALSRASAKCDVAIILSALPIKDASY